MNAARKEGEQSLIVVARVVKTKGLKGEIVADLLTDFPERFEGLSRLYAVAGDDERKEIKLDSYSLQQGRLVLKLAGYDSIETARTLIGYDLAVTEAERVRLPDDEFYEWELEGCVVETISGKHLGRIVGVIRTGGVALLAVKDDQQQETLIPMANTIVLDIDLEHKRIMIDPPEGLLDL